MSTFMRVQAMPCLPCDWLDVLNPLAQYLRAVTLRFSGDLMQQPEQLDSAQKLLHVMVAATDHDKLLPADGQVAKSSKAPDWRRLLADLALRERYTHAHASVVKQTVLSVSRGAGMLRAAENGVYLIASAANLCCALGSPRGYPKLLKLAVGQPPVW